MTISLLNLVLIIVGGVTRVSVPVLLFCAFSVINLPKDRPRCEMTYMWPDYVPLSDKFHSKFHSKYSLWLFKERALDSYDEPVGMPVLFIPGNAGSSRQVRSLGSVSAHMFERTDSALPYDFFAVETQDELTAFDFRLVWEQAEYSNEAIAYILSLYKGRKHRPDSVIIIAHSMGGIVARTLFLLPNYANGSVKTILTLATPHVQPPIALERGMVDLYRRLNTYWRSGMREKGHLNGSSHSKLSDVALVSIAGGNRDLLVSSELTVLSGIVPHHHGFSVFSSGIPKVWSANDHLSILWCNQLVVAIIRGLYSIQSHSSLSLNERVYSLKSNLYDSAYEDSVLDLSPLTDDAVVSTRLLIPDIRPFRFKFKTGERVLMLPSAEISHTSVAIALRRTVQEGEFRLRIAMCRDSAILSDCREIKARWSLVPKLMGGSQFKEAYHLLDINLENYNISGGILFIHDYGLDILDDAAYLDFYRQSDVTALNFSYMDLLLGRPQDVETKHIVTRFSVPVMKYSLFRYTMRMVQLCNDNATVSPIILQYSMESPELKFYHAYDVLRIGHFIDSATGLMFQFFSDGSCVKHSVTVKFDLLGTVGACALRYYVLVLSPIGSFSILALFDSLYASSTGRDTLGASLIKRRRFLLLVWIISATLTSLQQGSHPYIISLIYPACRFIVGFSVVQLIDTILFNLVQSFIYLCEFIRPRNISLSLYYGLMVTISVLSTPRLLYIVVILFLLLSPTLVTNPKTRSFGATIQRILLCVIVQGPYYIPQILVWLKNIVSGWTLPHELTSVESWLFLPTFIFTISGFANKFDATCEDSLTKYVTLIIAGILLVSDSTEYTPHIFGLYFLYMSWHTSQIKQKIN